MNFLDSATKLWTSAKTTILAGVAQVKDDTGIEQIYISEEFEQINQNFKTIARRTNQIVSSLNGLINNLVGVSNAFSCVVNSFQQCLGEKENAILFENLNKASTNLQQITATMAKEALTLELINPYMKMNNEIGRLYSVRSELKNNYTLYKQYRTEFSTSYGSKSSNAILESNRAATEKYKNLYEKLFRDFKERVFNLNSEMEAKDDQCLVIYNKIERQYIQNVKIIFDELPAEDPEDFNVDVEFVNIAEDDFDIEVAQEKDNDSISVPVELDSELPSLE